ncbi:hypothetical protein VTO42DRAFT_3530 [Malbranchea cinnamomea]
MDPSVFYDWIWLSTVALAMRSSEQCQGQRIFKASGILECDAVLLTPYQQVFEAKVHVTTLGLSVEVTECGTGLQLFLSLSQEEYLGHAPHLHRSTDAKTKARPHQTPTKKKRYIDRQFENRLQKAWNKRRVSHQCGRSSWNATLRVENSQTDT